jgi:hypothetical protein
MCALQQRTFLTGEHLFDVRTCRSWARQEEQLSIFVFNEHEWGSALHLGVHTFSKHFLCDFMQSKSVTYVQIVYVLNNNRLKNAAPFLLLHFKLLYWIPGFNPRICCKGIARFEYLTPLV